MRSGNVTMRAICSTITILICLLAIQKVSAQTEKVPLETWIAELSSNDPARAALAADMLGDFKEAAAPAIPVLVKALQDDRQSAPSSGPVVPLVCTSAQFALAKIGAPAVPALVAALETEKDDSVRFSLLSVLASIGKPAAEATPLLKKLVESDHEQDKLSAFYALCSVHPQNAEFMQYLIATLDNDDPDIRATAARKLGEYQQAAAPAVERLQRMLQDTGGRWEAISHCMITTVPVRADATEALGRIGPAAAPALPTLAKMMRLDAAIEVRAAAAVAVARIDPTQTLEAVDALLGLLSSPHHGARAPEAAANALAEIGPPAKNALPALIMLLHSKDRYQRLLAADALAAVGQHESLPFLIDTLLFDPDEYVRSDVLEIIVGLAQPHK